MSTALMALLEAPAADHSPHALMRVRPASSAPGTFLPSRINSISAPSLATGLPPAAKRAAGSAAEPRTPRSSRRGTCRGGRACRRRQSGAAALRGARERGRENQGARGGLEGRGGSGSSKWRVGGAAAPFAGRCRACRWAGRVRRDWARCGLRERWELARGTAACTVESGQREPSTLANAWPLWCCRSALASFASMGVAAHGPHQPRRVPRG